MKRLLTPRPVPHHLEKCWLVSLLSSRTTIRDSMFPFCSMLPTLLRLFSSGQCNSEMHQSCIVDHRVFSNTSRDALLELEVRRVMFFILHVWTIPAGGRFKKQPSCPFWTALLVARLLTRIWPINYSENIPLYLGLHYHTSMAMSDILSSIPPSIQFLGSSSLRGSHKSAWILRPSDPILKKTTLNTLLQEGWSAKNQREIKSHPKRYLVCYGI